MGLSNWPQLIIAPVLLTQAMGKAKSLAEYDFTKRLRLMSTTLRAGLRGAVHGSARPAVDAVLLSSVTADAVQPTIFADGQSEPKLPGFVASLFRCW